MMVRAVRSVRCGRHRRSGFDGSLTTFGSRLALRALLGRPSSSPCALHGDCLHSVRAPCEYEHASLSRSGLVPLARSKAAVTSSKDPFSLRRSRHGSQLMPGLPYPGYRRHAQGFSPSPRLDGSLCLPGLFHPGPARGIPPFRAFSLCRAVAPLDARCPPDVPSPLPAPNRSLRRSAVELAFRRVTCVFRRKGSSA